MNPSFGNKSRLMGIVLSAVLLIAATSVIYWMFVWEPKSQDSPREVAAEVHSESQAQPVATRLSYAFSSREKEHIQNADPLPGEGVPKSEAPGSDEDVEHVDPGQESTGLTESDLPSPEPQTQGGWVKGEIISESAPASTEPFSSDTAAPPQTEPEPGPQAVASPLVQKPEPGPTEAPQADTPAPGIPKGIVDLASLDLSAAQGKKLPKGQVWVINALSTQDEKKRNRLIKTLAPSYKVYAYKTEVKGTTWQRVRVGFFSTKEEAQKIGEKIAQENNLPEPWIVQPGPIELANFYQP